MKNGKRLASWVLILALLVSVLSLSEVAYGSTSPTLKDDGIDGSNMKPGSPAFGNYTLSSSGNEMADIGIFSTTVYNDTVYVPKNKTGNEGKRIATFKLQENEDRVRVTFISSQDKNAMNQINVSLANYSSGTVISWYPGLEVGDTVTFDIDDPSYTDYYAVYVSTNRTPGKANIDIRTLKSSTLVEITATNMSTLKDDGIDGSKMKPGSPAFGTNGVKVEVESDNHEDDPAVPKNKTGNEQARIATFKLQEGQDKVKVTFDSSENEDDMNQINVSLVNYSFGKVISWCPGLKVGGAITFNIDNPSYTDYYAVYVSTDQTPARAGISIKTQLGIKTK